MEGRPSNHKYIKVGDRIGPMVKEDISLDQMIETGVMMQIAMQDRIIGVIDLEETLENMVGRIVGKAAEVKGMVTTTIEIGTYPGKEHL